MFAKLFDSIRLPSLFYALVVASLGTGIFFGLVPVESVSFYIAGNQIFASLLAFRLLAILTVVLSSWLLANGLNSLRFANGNYHAIPVFSFLFSPFILASASLNLVLALPLIILLMIRLLRLEQGYRLPFVLFDVGVLIGISSILVPEAVIFLLISWMAIFSFGNVYFRAFLMPVIGIFGFWFVLGCLLFFSGLSVSEFFVSLFAEVKFFRIADFTFPDFWKWIPFMVMVLLGFLLGFSGLARAGVFERRVATYFAVAFLILAVSGIFISEKTNLWAWMCIPLTFFTIKVFRNLKKAWQCDLIYVLLLISCGLFFF